MRYSFDYLEKIYFENYSVLNCLWKMLVLLMDFDSFMGINIWNLEFVNVVYANFYLNIMAKESLC